MKYRQRASPEAHPDRAMNLGSVYIHPTLAARLRIVAIDPSRAVLQWLPSGRCFSMERLHAFKWLELDII